jgi:tRNA(Arg) A34 adenosine deaminase TadA
MKSTTEKFMRMAIAEARKGMSKGNHPFGSVIAKDGRVMVRAHSTGVANHDATAHADISAARKLLKKSKTRDVKGCTVYATAEPCPMCSVALALANISELVIAANYDDMPGSGRRRPGNVTYKEIFKEYGLNVKVQKGVLREEVLQMYQEFVRNR